MRLRNNIIYEINTSIPMANIHFYNQMWIVLFYRLPSFPKPWIIVYTKIFTLTKKLVFVATLI